MNTVHVRSAIGEKAGFWHFMLGEFLPVVGVVARGSADEVVLHRPRSSAFARFYDELRDAGAPITVLADDADADVAGVTLRRWDVSHFGHQPRRGAPREELRAAAAWLVERAVGRAGARAPEPGRVVVQLREVDEAAGAFFGRPRYGPDRRRVTNLDDVANHLGRAGLDRPVQLVSTADTGILDQVAAHAGAAVLVLGHGAGAVHSAWMRPGGLVVEVVPRKKEGNLGAAYLAHRFDHQVRRIMVDSTVDRVEPDDVVHLVATHLGREPTGRADAIGHDAALREHDDLVRWSRVDRRERLERNHRALERLVVPWSDLVTRHRGGRPRRGTPVVHFHVPKTGGTTFQDLLAQNRRPGQVAHVNAPRLVRDPAAFASVADRLRETDEDRGRARSAVTGHHQIDGPLYQIPDRPFVNVTMIRDPLRRVVSHYHYIRDSRDHSGRPRIEGLSLEEYVRRQALPESANGQTRRLGGGSLARRGLLDDGELLASAKETLEHRFSLFGLTERYDEFLIMCHRLLGWENIFYRRKNVNAPGGPPEIPPETRELIRSHNGLDVALYEFASELFQRRVEELGITGEDVARFREANAAYGAIVDSGW